MVLIDTHTHLYSDEFQADISQVMDRAFGEGVQKFYLPSIDSNSTSRMFALEEAYPQQCIAMMGLHPCYVKANYKEEMTIVKEWLSKRKFAAIGEIGLDFYWDTTFSAEQYDCFREQIELALQYNLPIVIHTRKAMKETIDIVLEYVNRGLTGIFHCFGGTFDDAQKIISAGFYLGIGGVITYKNAGLAQVVEKIDMKHLVLETDAPYLTPDPFRGKRNESSYLKYVAQKIADIKKISIEEVAEITTDNAKKIFGG